MSRKNESQSRRYKTARKVERPKSAEIPIADAKLIGGPGWLARVDTETLRQWEKRGWVPSYQLSKELWEWFNDERGKIPPPDPFANYPAELVFALKLMIRYYQIVDDPKADHWVAVIAGFSNRMEQANAEFLAAITKERERAG